MIKNARKLKIMKEWQKTLNEVVIGDEYLRSLLIDMGSCRKAFVAKRRKMSSPNAWHRQRAEWIVPTSDIKNVRPLVGFQVAGLYRRLRFGSTAVISIPHLIICSLAHSPTNPRF
jgi:hypothetical protein